MRRTVPRHEHIPAAQRDARRLFRVPREGMRGSLEDAVVRDTTEPEGRVVWADGCGEEDRFGGGVVHCDPGVVAVAN